MNVGLITFNSLNPVKNYKPKKYQTGDPYLGEWFEDGWLLPAWLKSLELGRSPGTETDNFNPNINKLTARHRGSKRPMHLLSFLEICCSAALFPVQHSPPVTK